jgi:hypothetical protein
MQQASWYYCNKWNLGDGVALVSDDTGTGSTFPLSRAHQYQQQKDAAMARALEGIDCHGLVYNAPPSPKL